jgi:glycosyltransferase involved in cell wall biosynthesis
MKTSIVIPTHNHCDDLLKPCLESVMRHTDLTDVEIVIVANGCRDNTKEYLEDKPVKLLWFDEGLGYTKATNAGIKAATGDVIVLLNNDVVLLDWQNKNAWLDRLVDPLKDKGVGITAALKIFDQTVEREFAVFFCVAMRRELFDEVGLLDEAFSPGAYDDVDFCIRTEELGYRVVMVANKRGVDRNLVVTDYPIYHNGEGTMLDAEHAEEWHKVIERNKKILADRHPKLPDGAFTPLDVAEYRRLANEVPDGGTICELGVWKGRSLCSIADIIRRKRLKVIAVDTFQGSVDYEPEKLIARSLDLAGIFRANTQKFGIDPTIYQMTGDEASQLMADRSIDLLFIDANHGYEAVRNDLEKWEPKIRGVIGGHDYNGPMYPNPSWPGVKRAVDERYRDIHYDGVSLVWSKKV